MSLFNLVLNTCGTQKAYFDFGQSGNPFVVHPNGIFDLTVIDNSVRDYLKPVPNFLNAMDKLGVDRFYIQRTFALGDVLQLVPVIRYLNANQHQCYMRTGSSYLEVLDKLGLVAYRSSKPTTDYGLLLDGTVERDHVIAALQRYHRVDLYFDAVGVKDFPIELDWSCDLSKFDAVPDDFVEAPYIVFQGAASGPSKSLPEESVHQLIQQMNEDGFRVAVVGGSSGVVKQKNYDEQMTNVFFKSLTLQQLFWLISKSQCLVCMDSSPLWISHFTTTPVIALLGASRVEQRLVRHPLYPEGAIGIELSKEVACEPCFESAKACDGQRRCLSIDPKKIYSLINLHIKRFINGITNI